MKIIENSILKEKLYTKTYKSGLRAYVMPKAGYDKSFATFATHFGSINDKFIVFAGLVSLITAIALFIKIAVDIKNDSDMPNLVFICLSVINFIIGVVSLIKY